MLILANKSKNLLDQALCRLLLGRASLFHSLKRNTFVPAQVKDFLTRGVEGVREAGRFDYLPIGLLTRAVWARVTKQVDQAHRDLAEAFAIAERGEMQLHLTDCHLESARLALTLGDTTSAHAHWQQARDLIEQTGYHRRDGELAEIAAILQAS